jgi:hypothetical protein
MNTQITASRRIISLIEDAAMKAGNESQLAKMVEETRHNVSAWKHGRRTCPLEAQVLMAAIAGRDIDQVMREGLIERNANTAKGEKLISALGKGLMGIGGATALTLCGTDAMAANLPGLLRCIFWLIH